MLHGMGSTSPGIKTHLLHWKHGFLATGPAVVLHSFTLGTQLSTEISLSQLHHYPHIACNHQFIVVVTEKLDKNFSDSENNYT